MERLTFEGNFCDIAQCMELPCKYPDGCSQWKVWERLKAYEDAEREGRVIVAPLKIGDTVYMVRLRERDMVALTVVCVDFCSMFHHEKPGNKVYNSWTIRGIYTDERGRDWSYTFDSENIGENVFLTREAAVAVFGNMAKERAGE